MMDLLFRRIKLFFLGCEVSFKSVNNEYLNKSRNFMINTIFL